MNYLKNIIYIATISLILGNSQLNAALNFYIAHKDDKHYPGDLHIPVTQELTPEQKRYEKKFAKILQEDVVTTLEKYKKLEGSYGGVILSTDLARSLYADYNKEPEKYVASTYQPAYQFIRYVLEQKLQNPPVFSIFDPKPQLILMVGGQASGKSTSIKTQQLYQQANLIYDELGYDFEDIEELIQRALHYGWEVNILFIYKPIRKAVVDSITRTAEEGRPVSLYHMAEYHTRAQETFTTAAEKFASNVNFYILDNSFNTVSDVYQGIDESIDFISSEDVKLASIDQALEDAVETYNLHKNKLNEEAQGYYEFYLPEAKEDLPTEEEIDAVAQNITDKIQKEEL